MKIQVRNKKKGIIFCSWIAYVIITLAIYWYRVTLYADTYDEIINLGISYRVALGDVPFYKCWEAFQGGNLFLAPFIYAYIHLKKSTTGLVLFSRCVYVTLWLLLSIYIMFVLKRIFTKRDSFFIAYPIAFFEIYSLFYFWYDTVSIYLLVLGGVSLLQGYFTERKRYFVFAGISHCLMVLAYPSFIIVALFYGILIFILGLVKKDKFINSIKRILMYAGGAVVTITLMIIYWNYTVGLIKVFNVLKIILGTRGINQGKGGFIVYDICKTYAKMNKYLVLISIFLFIAYVLILKYKKCKTIFVVALLILPFFNILFNGFEKTWGLADYISYIMLWGPFVWLLKEKCNQYDKECFFLLWVPSIISCIAIALTTVYAEQGPIKSWQACLSGFLVCVIFIVELLMEENKSVFFRNITLTIIPVMLIINSYYYTYMHKDYVGTNDKRIEEGIYCGIKVNENMQEYDKLQEVVQRYSKNCKTIMASGRLRAVYLMTDLKPCTWSVESPNYYIEGNNIWDKQFEYMDYFGTTPDIVFIEQRDIENTPFEGFLNEHYKKVYDEEISEYKLQIYKKK